MVLCAGCRVQTHRDLKSIFVIWTFLATIVFEKTIFFLYKIQMMNKNDEMMRAKYVCHEAKIDWKDFDSSFNVEQNSSDECFCCISFFIVFSLLFFVRTTCLPRPHPLLCDTWLYERFFIAIVSDFF